MRACGAVLSQCYKACIGCMKQEMKQAHTGAKIRCVCLMEKNKCSLNMGGRGLFGLMVQGKTVHCGGERMSAGAVAGHSDFTVSKQRVINVGVYLDFPFYIV